MWNARAWPLEEALRPIVTCHHLVSGWVAELQLDRPVVHQVYRELIRIQLRWADYEAHSGEEESTPTNQTRDAIRKADHAAHRTCACALDRSLYIAGKPWCAAGVRRRCHRR